MIKVLHPGFYSTIQDSGRIGFQQYGVPYSGVMDIYSAALANHTLGNKESASVIEMTMTGATLQFYYDTYICISGADMVAKINDTNIMLNKSIKIISGDKLTFGKLKKGFRSYLAVSGGFKTETIMNSQSMYKGITTQSRISKNDELKINSNTYYIDNKHALIKVNNELYFNDKIEVFKGPEFELLSKNQQEFLFQMTFTISKDNNRMAYQLLETLDNSLEPIITSAVLPGTVQLTPSGKLIVLMRDCQTTGGYPRVLQLKESAINILAQKFTGNVINFKLV
jgi:biotin-dependent carboxylase-like uncharacterized protein